MHNAIHFIHCLSSPVLVQIINAGFNRPLQYIFSRTRFIETMRHTVPKSTTTQNPRRNTIPYRSVIARNDASKIWWWRWESMALAWLTNRHNELPSSQTYKHAVQIPSGKRIMPGSAFCIELTNTYMPCCQIAGRRIIHQQYAAFFDENGYVFIVATARPLWGRICAVTDCG